MNPSVCCPEIQARCVKPAGPWCTHAGTAQGGADSVEDRGRISHNETESS